MATMVVLKTLCFSAQEKKKKEERRKRDAGAGGLDVISLITQVPWYARPTPQLDDPRLTRVFARP
jgi:hypothetical protein